MSPNKLSIGGLKVSPPLALIVMRAGARPSVAEVFQRFAHQRINMTLVALETIAGQPAGTCCIDQEELAAAEALLGPARNAIEIVAPVASLTLYPHKARLVLLQAVLWAFGQAGLPVHAVASSLSALSVATDYSRLDDALAAIETITELPPNHAPLRPTVRVRQI
jgi:hypothetical protein